MIPLPTAVVSDLSAATAREWLVTNGLGSYGCGTVSGVATRRYHGLLVAALRPPRGRYVLVTHLDETVCVRGACTALGAQAFPGGVFPDGWRYIDGFTVDPLPVWRYRIGDVVLERAVCMVRGQNTTLVRYTLTQAPGAVSLVVRPFGAFREFHRHARANPEARLTVDEHPGRVVLRPYPGLPAVTVAAPGIFRAGAHWWRDFVHTVERDRGLDDREDLFTPGEFVLALAPGETTYVVLSSEDTLPADPAACEAAERSRLHALESVTDARVADSRVADLHRAVDVYRAECADPPALLAGHPWFEDWGRDTLISFVGAYLVTGRWAAGRELLRAFARYVDGGMLPNRFPDEGAGGAEYNTVDAPVWFFHAARRYVQYTGDRAFAREVLYPALAAVERGYRAGTRYGIRVDAEGLVTAGDPGTQLTWMDARVEGRAITPRYGRPVEINALWHAGLRTLGMLAEDAGDATAAGRYITEADKVRDAFRRRFWNGARGYLYDTVRDDWSDPSVRPNALYAVALPGDLLPPEHAAAVLSEARRSLVVPLALRTLAPGEPGYTGRYGGGPHARDTAYHQGTAWPFLLGAYTSAVVREAARTGDAARVTAARREVLGLFDGLEDALTAGCVGHLPEVMDGDPPHRPGGCFAQAWSDCEALRALVEDGHGEGPPDTV